jgi:hypothetical protein
MVAALACLVPATALALNAYSEDFESLSQGDTGALGAAGWLVFGNVFDPIGNYLYGYGVFPAPNDGGGFCAIAEFEGGASQGAQQLVTFSDYNNGDHANGNIIEALVFQEQAIGAGDVGETWNFAFDAKLGNLEGASEAFAFIKTLDPNAGYATTNFIPVDMTNTPAVWSTYQITLTIDASLVGQLFQIGFATKATNYEGSGVFYDNIQVYPSGAVPNEDRSWGEMKALFR